MIIPRVHKKMPTSRAFGAGIKFVINRTIAGTIEVNA